MSTLRVVGTSARQLARPQATRTLGVAPRAAAKRKLGAAWIAVIGLVSIQIISLVLSAFISQGAFTLVHIKDERKALGIQREILAAQVDSLSSQQNLANAANGLGMVANSNPVFLRLADQKVIGTPKPAYKGDGVVSANLVPNAVLTSHTNIANLKSAPAVPVTPKVSGKASSANVATGVSAVAQVDSTGSIPTSPTR